MIDQNICYNTGYNLNTGAGPLHCLSFDIQKKRKKKSSQIDKEGGGGGGGGEEEKIKEGKEVKKWSEERENDKEELKRGEVDTERREREELKGI